MQPYSEKLFFTIKPYFLENKYEVINQKTKTMKTKMIMAAAVIASVLMSSCEDFGNYVTPSPSVSTEIYSMSDFSGLEVSHAFNVYVYFSDTEESVEIEANENLHQYIEVKERGNTLSIGIKDRINIRHGDATLNAYITTSNLDAIEASGACDVYLQDDLETDHLYVDLSGASSLTGYILTDELIADMSGASDLKIEGYADYFSLDASGSSTMTDYDFEVEEFVASLSGASDAYLTVNDELSISASGASSIYFYGKGRIKSQDLSGASGVHRME
jgi:FlaG/FlaF family flagellin (archaellin)